MDWISTYYQLYLPNSQALISNLCIQTVDTNSTVKVYTKTPLLVTVAMCPQAGYEPVWKNSASDWGPQGSWPCLSTHRPGYSSILGWRGIMKGRNWLYVSCGLPGNGPCTQPLVRNCFDAIATWKYVLCDLFSSSPPRPTFHPISCAAQGFHYQGQPKSLHSLPGRLEQLLMALMTVLQGYTNLTQCLFCFHCIMGKFRETP